MKLPARALLLLALLAPGTAARAEDPEGERPLAELEALLDESVVTTATRTAERASSAPATMFTITAQEIAAYGMRSIDEALAFLGVGMHVQKARDYATGLDVGAQGIMLRDYGRRLLVLLDGHVMNSQTSGQVTLHEGLGVPLDAIDHIEVMLGAGSVMYGSNAMTAVVHVITRRATNAPRFSTTGELSLALPSSSDGSLRAARSASDLGYRYRAGAGASYPFTLRGTEGSVAIYAEWLHELSETYDVALPPSPYVELRPGETTWNGGASHTMRSPSGVLDLRLGRFRLALQGGSYRRTMPLVGVFNDANAFERREALRLDLSHERLLNERVNLRSRLYGDFMRATEVTTWIYEYWCLPDQPAGCSFHPVNRARSFGLEQVLSWDPRLDGTLVTMVGFDARFRDTDGRPSDIRDLRVNAPRSPFEPPSFHTRSFLGALFAQQIYQPMPMLTLNAGLRLDIDSVFGARLSPRIAVSLAPSSTTQLRLSYAEAFRAPTPLELRDGDLTYKIPPHALDPEILRTAEFEVAQRIGWASLALRGFLAFYEDLIDLRPASQAEFERALAHGQAVPSADPSLVYISDNLQSIRSYGGTLTLQLRPLRGLSAASSITWSHTRMAGEEPPVWPRLFGNLRVSYAFTEGGPTLALAAQLAHRRSAFNDIDPSYVRTPRVNDELDLRLTLSSPVRALPGFKLRAGLGARVGSEQPYALLVPTVDQPRLPFVPQRTLPRLYALLGIRYEY